MNDSAQVMHGYSHLIFESPSLGLFLRYVLNQYKDAIKLEFSDSIALSENGCLEELYF